VHRGLFVCIELKFCHEEEITMTIRSRWIVGNWKMHGSMEGNAQLIANIQAQLPKPLAARVAVCPPFPYLVHSRTLLAQSAIALGAQDVSAAASGAHTGQVSASMLREVGCELVIVGHSERRHGLGETDETVAQKAKAALAAELTPIVCVGELLSEREAGRAIEVVSRQLRAALTAAGSAVSKFIVAYEPVWAIGTGKTATPQDAQTVHAALRAVLHASGVPQVPILYGGSVKADNARSLLAMEDIDGALVGGAALDASAFAAICAAVQ
jgi:triosephosphate isomerase